MQSPFPRRTRPIRHARRALRQARPDRHCAGLGQEDAVAVAGAEEEFCAGALEIRAGARRARCRRPAHQHRARRAAQSHPVLIRLSERLRHRAHHGRRLSDDHAGRMGARASPHAECAAADPRLRARHVHRSRRRQDRHGAGRRAADAELVEPRPRQRQPRLRLLARFPRRAAGATARADVLRAGGRGQSPRGVRDGAPPTKDSPFVFPIDRYAQAPRCRRAEPAGPVRHPRRARQSGDGHDRAAHDAARPKHQNRAVSHHRKQYLRDRQRQRRDHGRRRALRMEPRRRDRRARLAAALPRGRRRCADAARHRRAGDAAAWLPSRRGAAPAAH